MMQAAFSRLTRTRFVVAYMRALDRAPLGTKCATSGTLMVGSDVTRQWLEVRETESPFAWDPRRTLRLTAFAIGFHAPFLHACVSAASGFFPGAVL